MADAPGITVSDHDLDNMARTLWGECRGEIKTGQIAVAWVIRTRAAWRPPQWWGASITAVCLRHSASGIHQFSCWNKGAREAMPPSEVPVGDGHYQLLLAIARRVCAGLEENPAPGATHYKRVGTIAPWADRDPILIVGNHEFYALGPGG